MSSYVHLTRALLSSSRDKSVCMHNGRIFHVTRVLMYSRLVQSCSHLSDTSVLMYLAYPVHLIFYSAIQKLYPRPLIQSNHRVLPPRYPIPFLGPS
jgi:hypothetical protein